MFTENYIKWQNLVFTAGSTANMMAVDGANCSARRWISNGSYDTTQKMSPKYAMTYPLCQSMLSPGLYFGSGTTPASKKDYALERLISQGLSFTSQGTPVMGQESEGKYVVTVSHTVKNASDSTITISEIGLAGIVYVSNAGDLKYVLIERTVLTEPISLQPDEEKIITYKITFNQTQA